MTNPDPRPVETVCAPGAGAAAFELLEPRDVPLGGLRAMTVRRTLPQRSRSLIGAWCFVDHYGPDDVAATGGMDVAAHPHIGLQTASWLFSGEIEHRDSAGFHAGVRPGELNLMTAGRGISHSERSTRSTTVLHGVQLWIALPERRRGIDPGFAHYAPPVRRGAGWSARVFLGRLLGETSPVRPHTPLLGAEITLAPHAELEFGVDAGFEHGVLVDSGELALTRIVADAEPGAGEPGSPESGISVSRTRLVYTPVGADRLRLSAGAAGARVLLLGGEPLGERIVMWWNFVGRDHGEIAQARADWQAGIARLGVGDPSGAGDPDTAAPAAGAPATSPGAGAAARRASAPGSAPDPERFGIPAGEPAPPIPAPALPATRILPRSAGPAARSPERTEDS
ncbi:pirin family protein [Leucobacter allii]|uniref:Pirin family protein n=1 Tax=Leucobacter allii TaxID=2932247 RepID=A0ABY4FNQ4_9MICO|nr:pirin family protein [Leucobacter allii]UOQ57910.1 pirin family protein [Leucobacter allii]